MSTELTTDGVNYICGRLDGWRVPRTDDGIAWKIWMPGSTPYGYYKSADDVAERFPAYCTEWGAAGPLFDRMGVVASERPMSGRISLQSAWPAMVSWDFTRHEAKSYGDTGPEAIARAYIEMANAGWLGPEARETAMKAVEEWEGICNEQS